MNDIELYINEDGSVQAIYTDDLASVFPGADMQTRRASHVEPHPTKGGWIVDMPPVDGYLLDAGATEPGPNGPNGFTEVTTKVRDWRRLPLPDLVGAIEATVQVKPFTTRQAALDAERAWLDERMRAGQV